jgi:hypothetical protein
MLTEDNTGLENTGKNEERIVRQIELIKRRLDGHTVKGRV